MTIAEIKTAINGRITENGGRVYSNETDEGFDKPAFFVDICPCKITRISAVYEMIEIPVEIHYEPAIETETECFRAAELISKWFSTPIQLGDRTLRQPEDFENITDEDKTLFTMFTITTTRIVNEDAYSDDDSLMEDAELNIKLM